MVAEKQRGRIFSRPRGIQDGAIGFRPRDETSDARRVKKLKRPRRGSVSAVDRSLHSCRTDTHPRRVSAAVSPKAPQEDPSWRDCLSGSTSITTSSRWKTWPEEATNRRRREGHGQILHLDGLPGYRVIRLRALTRNNSDRWNRMSPQPLA